jgi:hypothetical protein
LQHDRGRDRTIDRKRIATNEAKPPDDFTILTLGKIYAAPNNRSRVKTTLMLADTVTDTDK